MVLILYTSPSMSQIMSTLPQNSYLKNIQGRSFSSCYVHLNLVSEQSRGRGGRERRVHRQKRKHRAKKGGKKTNPNMSGDTEMHALRERQEKRGLNSSLLWYTQKPWKRCQQHLIREEVILWAAKTVIITKALKPDGIKQWSRYAQASSFFLYTFGRGVPERSMSQHGLRMGRKIENTTRTLVPSYFRLIKKHKCTSQLTVAQQEGKQMLIPIVSKPWAKVRWGTTENLRVPRDTLNFQEGPQFLIYVKQWKN